MLATVPAGAGATTEQLAEYARRSWWRPGADRCGTVAGVQERGTELRSISPLGPGDLTDASLSYGVNVRNLTALQTLQAVRQAAGISVTVR